MVDWKSLGGQLLFSCNIKKDEIKLLNVENTFVKEILETWAEVHYCETTISEDNVREQILWNNSILRVENKPVYNRIWSNQGINKISDFLDDSERFLDYNRFCQMYSTSGIKWLDFNGIISAAKCYLKQYAPCQECSQVKTLSLTEFFSAKKPSRLVYTMLIKCS